MLKGQEVLQPVINLACVAEEGVVIGTEAQTLIAVILQKHTVCEFTQNTLFWCSWHVTL